MREHPFPHGFFCFLKGLMDMEPFYALALPQGDEANYQREILSCTVFRHLALAVKAAGGKAFLAGAETMGERMTQEDFFAMVCGNKALLLLAPVAALSGETLSRLVAQEECAVLMAGKLPLALWGQEEELKALDLAALPEGIARVQAAPGEGLPALDPESTYAVQEQLRRSINYRWMQKGVMLVDPNTTHISPEAELAPGCTILPGCLIYGESKVAAGALIGPNALLRDAAIGEGTTVNMSQVNESTVGAHTTVGPFAYIRPNCHIGDHVRIGDFVELKNSAIDDETKVSHLTYIGDTDLGKRINVGCGVVTVNYDGKKKYRTTVGDDCFVGCNVNLISPVNIGSGSYLAAGGTITEDVPEESFVIARARQTVKPEWVKKRKQAGKL